MAIQIKNLSKAFVEHVVLDNVNLYLTTDDKVGLIGPNGCGKTTLVRIIAGLEEKDEGTINIPRDNFSLGYLEQFADIRADGTLMSEAMRGAEKLKRMEERLRKLESEMASEDISKAESASRDYSKLLERFEHSGGYTFETDVKIILTALGFREPDWEKPAIGLSGGERTRLALARLLSEKPDFILLDEPTNHLDLPAIEWLENTLKLFDGGYLIISHDRRFLDSCCGTLYELERGKIWRYTGGYEGFLRQKADRLERERKMIEAQVQEIRRLKAFVARWSSDKIRGSQAMSRKKKLEKIQSDMIEASHREKAGMLLKFEPSVRSFDEVVTCRNIKKSFDGHVLFDDVNFSVRKTDRLAVIGRNGSGKTTLLRMMIGTESKDAGEIWWGDRTVWGYFSQTMEELDFENTVIDELMRLGRNIGAQDARNLLGRFLFSGDDIEKKVGDLSGGERSKLMFAVLLTRKPNCLVLDEPTNHLDLPSREILEEALQEYGGTLIFVSHDRAFIDRLATHTLELENGKAKLYHGNYSDLVYRKEQIKREAEERIKRLRREEIEEERKEKTRIKNVRRRKKSKGKDKSAESESSPEEIMNEIELIETQIESLIEELNLPENYMDFEKAGDLNKAIMTKKSDRDKLFEELERLLKDE